MRLVLTGAVTPVTSMMAPSESVQVSHCHTRVCSIALVFRRDDKQPHGRKARARSTCTHVCLCPPPATLSLPSDALEESLRACFLVSSLEQLFPGSGIFWASRMAPCVSLGDLGGPWKRHASE